MSASSLAEQHPACWLLGHGSQKTISSWRPSTSHSPPIPAPSPGNSASRLWRRCSCCMMAGCCTAMCTQATASLLRCGQPTTDSRESSASMFSVSFPWHLGSYDDQQPAQFRQACHQMLSRCFPLAHHCCEAHQCLVKEAGNISGAWTSQLAAPPAMWLWHQCLLPGF